MPTSYTDLYPDLYPGDLFPGGPLPVRVEILINNTWQDITHYVQTRDDTTPIVITGGQTDPGATMQPSQATMTLNNRDGRFSPGYASGAFFPYLQRNVQLRVSLVNATSSTGNVYSGYRFWGEVSDWPPLSDLTGRDIYVSITASGPLRRIRNGGGRGSALTRYYSTLSGNQAPIAYWPCEDDPYTSSVGTALQGGTNMTVTSGTPFWAAISNFDGSLPILIINKSVLTGLTGSTAATTTNVIRFVMMAPSYGANDFGTLIQFNTNGTVAKGYVYYRKGGKLQLRLFNGAGANIVNSTITPSHDGIPVMVSVELTTSGSNVNWAFNVIKPGATSLLASATGAITAASVSYVTQVIVDPFKNVLSTGIGHISVQNALIPLTTVSSRLNGHTSEMSIDRFIRLCNEQALSAEPEYNETNDHWGFETGTQSWTASNATVSQSATSVAGWPTDGTHSLLITAAGGAGQWFAHSPNGTSGQPVLPGDIVSVAADCYTPNDLGALGTFISINWYNAAGTFLSTFTGDTVELGSGGIATLKVKGTAPATAAFFDVNVGDSDTHSAGTLLYVDNVRVHPRMGPQTAKRYHELLEEIRDLDQGILKEAKDLWGLKYKTRISVINQSPALTLNYAAGQLSGQLQPVHDDVLTRNHIVVQRHKGSKVEAVLSNGTMSVLEPPLGVGRYKKHHKAVAEADEQLLALANHLLTIGTSSSERYPVVEVDVHRAENANFFSSIGGMEIGEYLQITNLPFWYPSSTAKQLVIGYTETLSNFTWNIKWNCTPENPFEINATALRRW